MSPRLVLASTSRYRRELLDRLGVAYSAVPHDVDERAFEERWRDAGGGSAEDLALALAHAKADSVRRCEPRAWIVGSDQACDLGGELLHKPGTAEGARAQLSRLSGTTHRLVTTIALHGPDGSKRQHVEVHRLRARVLTDDEIARYVAADDPLDCAGSYRIESRGIALFESVGGSDFTAITGLPLIALVTMLRAAGFPVP